MHGSRPGCQSGHKLESKITNRLPTSLLLSISLVACLWFPPAPAAQDEYDLAGEFAFVRLQWDSYYRGGFGFGPWSIDFPDADRNFLRGVARLSNVRVMPEPIVLRL